MTTHALITLSRHRIAIPHADILGIDNMLDARADDSTRRSYWMLSRGTRQWAVYSLDENLQLQALPDPQQRLLVCLRHHNIALTCVQIDTLPDTPITPLPALMHSPATSVAGLILHQQHLILQIDIDRICRQHQNPPHPQEAAPCNAMPGY